MAGLDPVQPDLEAADKPLDWLGVEFWPDGEFKPEEQLLRQSFVWPQHGDQKPSAEFGADFDPAPAASRGLPAQQVCVVHPCSRSQIVGLNSRVHRPCSQ